MIKFGMWSTTLLLFSVHGLIMALLLVLAPRNRSANRFLALLLLAVVLLITPFTIGYAGFYDAYPWLTFAPFFWQLSFGPLLYLYVRQLGDPQLPSRWGWHFAPAGLQGAYYVWAFLLPDQAKWDWNDDFHVPYVLPLQTVATYVSMLIYWVLALSQYREYQRWLEDNSAAREEFRLSWLRGFLIALAVMLLMQVGFELVSRLVRRLNYFDYFPMYVALALLVYYLGIEGWRNAARPFPQRPLVVPTPKLVSPKTDGATSDRNWHQLGRDYAARVAQAGWWREPELSLADLASRLGTNTQYLSRALNEGLDQSFTEFINRLRVEAAQRALAGPGDVLEIALAAGFGSKASFHRAFRAYVGCTPSEYRRTRVGARLTS